MSYTSSSIVSPSTTFTQVREIIELLGYRRVIEKLKSPNLVGAYVWYDDTDYRSWSGVELQVYKAPSEPLQIDTRSTVSRSYWDLVHQNRTLKLFRDLFGGHFQTDAGRNRYWRPGGPPPPPISSGCYLARWRLHNSFGRAQVYLINRRLEGQNARDQSSGFDVLDQFNPRLLSNNLLIPYMFAVWEEYFRATFTTCLRYSKQREAALKRAKLSHTDLERLVIGSVQVERSVAEAFSFQRPSAIAEAFRLVEPKLDIAGAMRKPYRGRKVTLFDSIEKSVEGRNSLVHTGELNLALFDKQLRTAMNDLVEAVNRAYDCIAKHYGFVPNYQY